MSKNSELHVVFGSGPVGLAVVDELVARGKRIRVVSRSGSAVVPAGVEVVQGDAANSASTRDLCREASHVYNCTNAPYHRWPELFPPLQTGILEGAAAAGAKLIVMENLYMYGPNGGKPLTEVTPVNGKGRRGITRMQMAKDLLAAHQSGKVQAVSARAADFFGPRVLESSAGERLFVPLLAGKAVRWLGDPDVPHSFTYIGDIGKTLVILGERDEALGHAWHIPSAPAVTPRQFITLAADTAGVQPPKINALKKSPLRSLVLVALGLFSPPIRGYSEVLYQFDEPFVIDSAKFEAAFGCCSMPMKDALLATVEWYRRRS